ncbi:hypothetical protein L484_012147 [Morus notabilis]|uniref:Uncharacterized protein n=1 Tax=Morus notabilis TaxID=981085 RepID=W9R7F1_9ROSA|nr:hypothetical protein L484_012147 [Morus notabilis]
MTSKPTTRAEPNPSCCCISAFGALRGIAAQFSLSPTISARPKPVGYLGRTRLMYTPKSDHI